LSYRGGKRLKGSLVCHGEIFNADALRSYQMQKKIEGERRSRVQAKSSMSTVTGSAQIFLNRKPHFFVGAAGIVA
jgi:hypothetical protein